MDIKKIVLKEKDSLKKALEVIDKGAIRLSVVVDDNFKVIGTISDGDIRRGILSGYRLDDSIKNIYFKNPTVAFDYESKDSIIKKAISKKIYQIPIVDKNYKLLDLVDLATLLQHRKRKNKVVIMAGGLGSRLRPLTDDIPKPMLKIGNKPILQTIIQNFKNSGFEDFLISVNYKKEIIKDYFKDGNDFGVNIRYLDEDKKLGTAGALSLIDEINNDFFVINGDLLTNIDFSKMLDFHKKENSFATMGVVEKEYLIPYGVIELENINIKKISEKPTKKYFINGGIYILNKDIIKYIPKNQYFDMPQLFEKLIDIKQKVLSFPIHEYWLDIGQLSEYEKAQQEFWEIFGG